MKSSTVNSFFTIVLLNIIGKLLTQQKRSKFQRTALEATSSYLPATEIHIPRHVIAEALLLRRQQAAVEHQEVRVLAVFDGTFGVFDAQLL